MSRQEQPSRLKPMIRRYGIVLLSVFAATASRLAIDPIVGDRFPFLTFFIGIVIVAWFGGFWPTLLAVLLSWVAIDRVVQRPSDVLADMADKGHTLFAFSLLGLTLAVLGEAVRKARSRASASEVEVLKALEGEQRQREWLRITLSSISDAVMTTDPVGNVVSLNPAAEALTGWTSAEASGRPLKAVFRTVEEESLRTADMPIARVVLGGEVILSTGPLLMVARDGTTRHVEHDSAPLRGDRGQILGAVLVFRDVSERRRADQIRRSLAAIVENSDDAIVGKDTRGVITSWNAAAERLYGYNAAEALGKPFSILVPSDREGEIHDGVRRLARGERLRHFETVRRMKDDGLVDVSVSYSPIKDEEGQLVGTAVIARDISERKRSEKALLASEERLRLALEAGRLGTWEWDVRTGELAWSDNLDEIHGLAKGTFDGTFEGFQGLIHVDDREMVLGTIARAVENRSGFDLEFRSIRGDGSVGWMSGKGLAFTDESGQTARMIGVGMDITERKKADEDLRRVHAELERRVGERTAELARANEFLRTLLESIQDGIVACDAQGVLTVFNRATQDFHGLPPEPIPAEKWAEHYNLYRPDGVTLLSAEEIPLLRALNGEHVRAAEMVIAPMDGPRRHLLASGQAFYDDRGNRLGAVVSMHDITQRKQAEEALRVAHRDLELRVAERTNELAWANEALQEADRRKDDFLATLAHELRNPLAPIRNALHLLKQSNDRDLELEAERAMAERQVIHLARLVDDLMDVSRINRGKIELRKEVVEFSRIVSNAVEAARSAINCRNHTISVAIPREPIYLEADPTRLEQIIDNLISNACKYTDPGGKISLTAGVEAGHVELRVADTGIGIESEMLGRIFEMFIQVEGSSTRSGGGLGIGLGLVKSLVEMHSGSIEARSDGPGFGSEFIVRLPAIEVGSRPVPVLVNGAPHAAEDLPTLRILVVDDNEDAANSLARVLRRLHGQTVEVAHDGPSAIDLIEAFRPDVLLLDIGMPGMDGNEVASRLRGRRELSGLLLVALTGWGQEADRERTRNSGFDLHFVKPVDPSSILGLLHESLSIKREAIGNGPAEEGHP